MNTYMEMIVILGLILLVSVVFSLAPIHVASFILLFFLLLGLGPIIILFLLLVLIFPIILAYLFDGEDDQILDPYGLEYDSYE